MKVVGVRWRLWGLGGDCRGMGVGKDKDVLNQQSMGGNDTALW